MTATQTTVRPLSRREGEELLAAFVNERWFTCLTQRPRPHLTATERFALELTGRRLEDIQCGERATHWMLAPNGKWTPACEFHVRRWTMTGVVRVALPIQVVSELVTQCLKGES